VVDVVDDVAVELEARSAVVVGGAGGSWATRTTVAAVVATTSDVDGDVDGGSE